MALSRALPTPGLMPQAASIAGRSMLVNAAAALLLLAAAGWAYIASVEAATKAAVQVNLEDLQARSIQSFDEWMEQHTQQARDWADRPDTQALVRRLLAIKDPSPEVLAADPLQQAFRTKFALAERRAGLQGYFIVSPEGLSLGSLGNDNLGTRNLLWNEPEFIAQMRTRGAALSPFMVSDVAMPEGGASLDGRPISLFVGVPISFGGTEPAAYFTIRIPPIGLLTTQSQTRFGAGGVSFMVDRFGRLQADRSWLNMDLDQVGLHSEPFRGRPFLFARDPGKNLVTDPGAEGDRALLPLTHAVQALQTSGHGSSLTPFRDHRGVPVVAAWTWRPELGLGVITQLPAAEAFAPVQRARQNVLVAAVVLAAIALAALMWRLQRSLLQLQGALLTAEAASRAKGVFLANMSHEIRTPLNAVLGITHLLGSTPLAPTQREYLQMIGSSGTALLGILNDILDYSKVEAGKLELVHSEFSLYEAIDTLASIMCVNAAPKDLELVIGFEPDVPTQLLGDSQRLLQVLVNLTGNAIKFTERGEVVLRVAVASRKGDAVRLRFEVRDSGIGIAPDKLGHLFAPFMQADPGIARHYGGTGLGLAICKRLVDLMQGEIGATSVLGQGSSFWFEIPLAVGLAPDATRSRAPMTVRDVLVVDDSEIAREFVSKSVERLGWRSHEVGSGSEAINRLTQPGGDRLGGYDVLLIDSAMPLMDGLQTASAVRAIEGLEQPPIVIMVTALGREQTLGAAEAETIDAVVAKPVTPSKILDAVMEAQAKRVGGYLRSTQRYAPARVVNQLLDVRLLLVEDNYINQQVARGMLEAEGAIVTTANDGAEAVELLSRRAEAFDLVLMDVQMPVMNGLEATRRLRRELRLTLPIIAMSAGVTQQERDVCIEAGMNDFIAKPLEPQAVVKVIRSRNPTPAKAAGLTPPMPSTAPSPNAWPSLPAIDGIDIGELAGALNNSRETLQRLLDRLAIECRQIVPELEEAIAKGDAAAAAKLLHGFKGVAANMRAKPLAEMAGSLEAGMRSNGIAAVESGLGAFRDSTLSLLDALDHRSTIERS